MIHTFDGSQLSRQMAEVTIDEPWKIVTPFGFLLQLPE
jgi:hypothetical protein